MIFLCFKKLSGIYNYPELHCKIPQQFSTCQFNNGIGLYFDELHEQFRKNLIALRQKSKF